MGNFNMGLCFLALYIMSWTDKKTVLESYSSFFDKKLRKLWEIIFLYIFAITMVFYYSPIWENLYIKDIIIWFLFSGLVYSMNAVSSEADETYIKKVLKSNLKFTMILEFFMNTFTFNIWIELAIIPAITSVTIMKVIAERKEEYRSVHKLLDSVLAITGFYFFYKTIKLGLNEYKQLNMMNTLVSFMIPIVYLILIIPLEYALEVYSKYEGLFIRMTFKEKDNKRIILNHRIAVFRVCNFSVRKILLFRREFMTKMYVGMKEDEFDELIEAFRIACKYL